MYLERACGTYLYLITHVGVLSVADLLVCQFSQFGFAVVTVHSFFTHRRVRISAQGPSQRLWPPRFNVESIRDT
ncbi:hypothetical protein CLCR_03199 [Cladophialophora carrionii]|uniref:Uncharacterized protein n=1 Tax=Cladophialophora carrionii TaxID=86049 RepID=A0A1C1D1I8_9EURO|nr:hypothetical protein CLCR_03199 [Cladophialophora carrionii]